MLTYREYYEICKKTYKNNKKIDKNLYDFTYELPIIDQFGENYLQLVSNISNFLDEKYVNKSNIYNVPGQNPVSQPLSRYKDPWDIPEIENLADILVTYMEENLFLCNLYTMATYVYRTNVGKYNSASVGSLLWHADNHPCEIIKVMVYLKDVDEKSGPFEVLDKDGSGCKFNTTRVDYNQWSTHHSRFSNEQIENLKSIGFNSKKLTGKQGTAIIFDNNIIHRATFCEDKPRDVIVFMVKPIDKKILPRICKNYTGTNYHKDVFKDPEFFGVVKK